MLIFLNQHKMKRSRSIFDGNIYTMPPKKKLSLIHPDLMPKLTRRVVGINGYYEDEPTTAGKNLEKQKYNNLKEFKQNDPVKYSKWEKEFPYNARSFESNLRDELKKEEATVTRRQERASSHSKAKKDHSDAKEYREASIFGSVLNFIDPLKTPKTPAQTPKSSRKGGNQKRRKRTLKKNH